MSTTTTTILARKIRAYVAPGQEWLLDAAAELERLAQLDQAGMIVHVVDDFGNLVEVRQ